MILIDTHTHLFLPEFDNDRLETVSRAIEAGVEKMLLPNIDSGSINPMMDLCNALPNHCFPMIGLHPTSVRDDFREQLAKMKDQLAMHKFVAIGEVGLDLYWDKTYLTEQCEALEFQIELSRTYTLPLVLHTRDAFPEILELLHKNDIQSYFGVFHSFSGTLDQAREVIDMGFLIGLNGVITFKNSNLTEVVSEIPLDKMILETDSPYLTPVPKRGQRNESAYLLYIAQKIADIKGLHVGEVALATTHTATRLFNL